jgi:predicted nucleic acid-binding protein
MIHAVVDVNVLVSALVGLLGFSRPVITAWQQQRIELLTSERIIAELDAKLRLPRIVKRLFDLDSPGTGG